MDETRATDIADVGGAILVGLGIVTVAFFPFALPLLILVIGPLALLAVPLLLLALPVLLTVWLVRYLSATWTRLRQRSGAAGRTSVTPSSRSSTRQRRPTAA